MGRRAYMRLIGLRQLTDFAANSGWGLKKAMMGQMERVGMYRKHRCSRRLHYLATCCGHSCQGHWMPPLRRYGRYFRKQQRLFDPGIKFVSTALNCGR